MLCERATGTSVAALFGGLVVFSVPPFQRVFAWEDDSVQAFLSDIERCYIKRRDDHNEPHFFGSIVTGPHEVTGTIRPHRQVLDGQQRLAVFALFIAALSNDYASLAEGYGGDMEEAKAALESRSARMIGQFLISEELDFMDVKDVYSLSLNQADDPFFKSLLRNETPEALTESHRRLEAANRAIRNFLREKREAAYDSAEEREVLNRLYACFVEDWELVHIEAGSARQASQIFRVLNNRGVPVSACDLLRASTLEACHNKLEDAEFEELKAAWTAITSLEKPSPDNALALIQKARFPMSNPANRTSVDFEATYFPELAESVPLIKQGARDLLKTVKKRRDDFLDIERLARGELVPKPDGPYTLVENSLFQSLLGELDQHWILPVILASQSLDLVKRQRMLLDLCLFAFRYKVICDGPLKPFERSMLRTIDQLNREPERFRFSSFEEDLRELIALHASDEAFERGLNDLSHTSDAKAIRFLLAMMEFTSAWFEEDGGGRPKYRAPDQGIDLSQITLEHVSAQNPEDVDPDMQPLLHTIGNLTLLAQGENDRARNRAFPDKRDILDNSNLRMNRQLAELDEWNAETATERQMAIVRQAIRVHSLDHTQQ